MSSVRQNRYDDIPRPSSDARRQARPPLPRLRRSAGASAKGGRASRRRRAKRVRVGPHAHEEKQTQPAAIRMKDRDVHSDALRAFIGLISLR